MKKLFFDDVRQAPDKDWHQAYDVPGAKFAMEQNTYDVMSLDHDIGMQMMCNQCYEEIEKPITSQVILDRAIFDKLKLGCNHSEHGTHLARWMAENLKTWPKMIIIHSANQYGAERMANILKSSAGAFHTEILVIPFHHVRYETLAHEELP